MVVRSNLNTLPVDRGWAWVIASAGFFAHLLTITAVQVNGLLFLDVLELFQASFTTGSLVFMFVGIAANLTSVVVTHYVMPKLKERGCLLLGGVLVSILSLGASFAPNIVVFTAILTVKGMANGLIYVPSMALIPRYFKRYRSRANIVPFCGASTGNIIIPFAVRAVREQYGVRATYLLLSAFELNYIVVGLLLRPVSAYRFLPDDKKPDGVDTSAVQSSESANVDAKNRDHFGPAAAENRNEKLLQVTNEKLTDDTEAAVALLGKDDDVDGTLHEMAIGDIDNNVDGTHREDNSDLSSTEFKSDATLKNDASTVLAPKKEDDTDKPTDKSITRWQKFYQASALDMWSYRVVVVASVPGSALFYMVQYLPTINKFQGASFEEAAFLATITGAVDLIGRIATGFIAETKVLPPSRLTVVVLMCLGIGLHFFRFATSFVALIPMTIFIGIFMGLRGPINSLLCQEVVGPIKFPQAFSQSLLVLTISAALLSPTLGALVEATGSFVLVLHILGICFLLSAGLLACLPWLVRLDVKQGRKK